MRANLGFLAYLKTGCRWHTGCSEASVVTTAPSGRRSSSLVSQHAVFLRNKPVYLRHRFFGTALISVLFTVACGSNGASLTGPSDQFPNVAGNYSGTTTVMYPELQYTFTCSTTTSVTQDGNRVSIAPLQLRGNGCIQSLPVGDSTIDRNGSLGESTGHDQRGVRRLHRDGERRLFRAHPSRIVRLHVADLLQLERHHQPDALANFIRRCPPLRLLQVRPAPGSCRSCERPR